MILTAQHEGLAHEGQSGVAAPVEAARVLDTKVRPAETGYRQHCPGQQEHRSARHQMGEARQQRTEQWALGPVDLPPSRTRGARHAVLDAHLHPTEEWLVAMQRVRLELPPEGIDLVRTNGVPPLKWTAWKVQMNRNSGGSENGKQTSEARGDRLEAAPG